ncbi:MAG TPA: AMP-binding protein [Candidatus Methylomirabilis sp.]|nr:AMP-binding protein [Candidatus Methylomirabilis sp.]
MIYRSALPDVVIPEVSYSAHVLKRAGEWAAQPVLVDGPSGRALTHGQVAGGARRVAASLARRGFAKGDVLAIYSPNLPEYALAFHGAAIAGGIVTTANPLYTAEELAFQLRDTGAKLLVTVPPFLERAREAARGTAVGEIFVFGEASGATPFAALLQGDGDVPAIAIDPARDLVALPYSSGTSGRPKGVMLTHRNLVAVTCQVAVQAKLDQSWRTIGILPFFHIYGQVVLMNFPLYFGGLCVTMPRFDLAEFLRLVQEHRLTHLYVVPPIVLALAKHPLVSQYDLSSVKLVNSGAAPLDESLQRECAARLGCLVTQGYGMTETSLACHVTPEDPARVRPGSVGQTLPGMESKLVDVDTGAELAAGERGEICVRGPNVMKGYWNDPEATARTIDAAGWLHTGDVGYADADGYFFVVDRVKELIKYKGMQVAPAELEGLLLTHPAIADAAVIPSPDVEAGEVPKAIVVLRSPLTPEAIMEFVAERVAPHKKVRRVEVVEAIPKSASGKILRRLLVEQERAARAANR